MTPLLRAVSRGGNAALVKRLGRWRSDAVHRYLWVLPTLGNAGLPAAMLGANTKVPWGAIYKAVLGNGAQ